MSEPYRIPPPSEEGDDLVAVGSRPTALEAEMAREYLKHHGITAFTHEAASFNPIMNEVLGGSRVLVRSADAERARSLLARIEKGEAESDEEAGDEEAGEVRCPRCELTYCFHEKAFSAGSPSTPLSPLIALPALLFGAFAPRRWRCRKCLHVWDDPKQGPAKKTPLAPDDPRPVFRLRRHRAGTGVMIGLMLMMLLATVTSAPDVPAPFVMLPFLLPVFGFVIGHSLTTDVCSAPGCRAALSPDAKKCPVCRGAIAGVIRGAHEHYAEAAAFRRELAAIRARDEERAAKRRALKKSRKEALPHEAR